jgi:hypothetical protein
MSITVVFDPPLPSDNPATFNNKAFTLLGNLNTWSNQANQVAGDINAASQNAATNASNASASASAAAASASQAEASAASALNSANAASASATAAANSFDAFDDRYLGDKASDPTTDNDGNALQVGALYWNTTANKMRVWDGSSWQAVVDVVNAATATKLQTARTLTIGNTGKSFDGSADVSWSLTEIGAPATNGTGATGTWGISVSGNAATATTLQTARTINGTSFNGSANITTANWGTARTITIGNTGKSVNGSANVSWSLAEIGVTAATETAPGIVELATAAEAQALASAVVALTPARLADAFKGANQSLSDNGYQKLPGGLIIQWGTYSLAAASSQAITFPIAFPTALIHTNVSVDNAATDMIGTISRSLTGMTIIKGVNDTSARTGFWQAIGY